MKRVSVLSAILFFTCLLPSLAEAFIPPVRPALMAIFKWRKESIPVEAVVRHQLSGGVVFRETLYRKDSQIFAKWQIDGSSQPPLMVRVSNSRYEVLGGPRLRRRSRVLLQYLLDEKPESLERSLLGEKFVRSDQLDAFDSEYAPEGNPKTWNTSEHLKKRAGVKFVRLPKHGVVIENVGMELGLDRRAVYFNRDLKGIVRLEWRQEGKVSAWEFTQFQKQRVGGFFPKRFHFEREGEQIVNSELVSYQIVSKKRWPRVASQFRTPRSKVELSPAMKSALPVVLNYR